LPTNSNNKLEYDSHCKNVAAMTELPEQAISHLKNLSINDQDAIASMILEELGDNMRWDKAFADSPDVLAKLAATTISEHRAGKTQELDPEIL
jgi:hypothetical protein